MIDKNQVLVSKTFFFDKASSRKFPEIIFQSYATISEQI